MIYEQGPPLFFLQRNAFLNAQQSGWLLQAATATSATFQAGPSRETLQSNNARAWINFLAGVFSLRVNASNSLRFWVVNVTRYRGATTAS